jgi:signal transduction histidine kinase
MWLPQPLDKATDQRQHYFLVWLVPSDSLELDWTMLQQDWLRQRQLANMGRMTVEMAHELSNPLSSISMAAQLMGMSLQALTQAAKGDNMDVSIITKHVELLKENLSHLEQSVLRASDLRQEILSYSRPSVIRPKPHQLNVVIEEWLEQQRAHGLAKHMQVAYEPLEPSPTILCDVTKLEQILYNLIKNTHEASDGKACVWIAAGMSSDDHWVQIRVEDNGPGIPEAMQEKIFSPFLTTKKATGSGLGLSISRDIIQQHGGQFSVYNKPERGACFLIQLPRYTPNQPIPRALDDVESTRDPDYEHAENQDANL